MIIRYAGSLVFAAVVTFGLFFLMQVLVAHGRDPITKALSVRSIDFVRLKKEEQIQEKKRKLPKKPPPEKPPPPPELAQTQTLKPVSQGIAVNTGDFDISLQTGDISLNAPNDGDILPLVRVPPQYPRRAEAAGIEGYVDIEFTISKTGSVINPVVIDAKPSGIFNRAALRAIQKWKYKPKIEDGQPVERYGVQVRITFELED